MSSANTKRVYIQIDSAAEQQENLKNQRKTFKVIQGVATDKENLTGRSKVDKQTRLKAAAVNESTLSSNSIEYAKRKKIETKTAETQTKSSSLKKITAEDLCSEENPGEHYWERLAENRRVALEQSLDENQRLYERIDGLEEEINTSGQQLEEAKHLVAVLTEMLNENEAEEVVGEGEESQAEGVKKFLPDNNSSSNDDQTEDSNSSISIAEEKK